MPNPIFELSEDEFNQAEFEDDEVDDSSISALDEDDIDAEEVEVVAEEYEGDFDDVHYESHAPCEDSEEVLVADSLVAQLIVNSLDVHHGAGDVDDVSAPFEELLSFLVTRLHARRVSGISASQLQQAVVR